MMESTEQLTTNLQKRYGSQCLILIQKITLLKHGTKDAKRIVNGNTNNCSNDIAICGNHNKRGGQMSIVLLIIAVFIISSYACYSFGWDRGYEMGREAEREEQWLRNWDAVRRYYEKKREVDR